jgi:hypothetical protein
MTNYTMRPSMLARAELQIHSNSAQDHCKLISDELRAGPMGRVLQRLCTVRSVLPGLSRPASPKRRNHPKRSDFKFSWGASRLMRFRFAGSSPSALSRSSTLSLALYSEHTQRCPRSLCLPLCRFSCVFSRPRLAISVLDHQSQKRGGDQS